MKSSILSLVIICLGAGTLSIPFVFYKNGIVVGTLLLAFAGFISYYTGYLIAICSERVNAARYEDIAMATYGKRASWLTSFSMLACCVGFVVSYIILLKGLLPFTIERVSKGKAPEILTKQPTAGIIWATIFTVAFVFPLSLPRQMSQLRFTGFASAVISVFIIFSIMGVCLSGKYTPHLGDAFKEAFENFDITMFGIFRSLPLIIFAFMYQTNIPMIYHELAKKNLKTMHSVLVIGTVGATCCYFIAGVFGYVTFIHTDPATLNAIMEK